MMTATKPCKHGIQPPGECEQCKPAKNGTPANDAWKLGNRLEKGAMLRGLVERMGRDAKVPEVLAETERLGMHGVSAGSVYKLRETLGFTNGAKKGKASPAKTKPSPKPKSAAATPAADTDESPLVSVAELREFLRLVKTLGGADIARQLLDLTA